MSDNFKLQIAKFKKIVDKELDKYLPKQGKLARAMRYSVFAGGKRFRPILCLATAKALGGSEKKVLPFACAVELAHTFTLIHDDLPAMDNADFRRGRPACHKVFGEAMAILAGDALNTLAFNIVSNNPEVSRELSEALLRVVDGQVSDLATEKKKWSIEQLVAIHRNKTAALLKACVRGAAIICRASLREIKALTSYAEHLGLAFQIADDILDVTATRKQLGKPVRADVEKGFPYVVGLEKSKKLAKQEKQRAARALKIFGKRAALLRWIAEYVVEREK
ncbi:MAG: polyprenyl synthetase family protein [Candidatus Margulisiibacteriota bacterium]